MKCQLLFVRHLNTQSPTASPSGLFNRVSDHWSEIFRYRRCINLGLAILLSLMRDLFFARIPFRFIVLFGNYIVSTHGAWLSASKFILFLVTSQIMRRPLGLGFFRPVGCVPWECLFRDG